MLQFNDINKRFLGRTKIEIPTDELTVDTLKENLPYILKTFFTNSKEIEFLDEMYRGKQDIDNKTKEVRETINNKYVENHAFEVVEFIKGYLVGKPVYLSQRVPDKYTDDVGLANTYMIEQDRAHKDSTLIEDIAKAGVGIYLCLPKTENVENIDKQAPFNIYLLNPMSSTVIYSSNVGNKKLGGLILTELPKNNINGRYLITIYAKNKKFSIYTKNLNGKSTIIKEDEFALPFVPMVEYYFNESRLGLIEVIKDSLDLLNKVNSSEMDDIEQFINNIMVIYNQDINKKDVELLRNNKILKLKSNNPQIQADVKFLQQQLQHGDINTFFTRIYNMMMGIVAIPKSGDRATSGGDTGEARLLGEGWTLADQRAMTYQNSFAKSEKELLDIAFWICRKTPNCKIDELFPSDVDVKFSISRSDNMLVKTQTMLNMNTLQLPEEIITSQSEFFNDPLEVAKSWKQNKEKINKNIDSEKQLLKDKEIINNVDNRVK